ncbi:MAG: transcription termination factor NusA [Candidatus Gastranaerophilales bacterium]|nr:transcription termination factor NusA [Candidatus Gastranaerophilales bacterium]
MIKFGSALMDAVEQIEREKGISKDIILGSLCDAMVSAYKKQIKDKMATNVKAILYEKSGEIGIYREKITVKKVEDESLEISLKDAKKIDPEAAIDKVVDIEVTPADFGRIAAQAAKQVITQRIREAERNIIIDEYMSKKDTLMTGIVQRIEYRNVVVNLGKTEAIMPPKEQLKNEYYKPGNRIRVYVLDVKETAKLPQVIVSQTHAKIVQELFELEVPEIEDGLVEIKNITREAGYRTKIAVASTDPDVDPVGACIGPRGSRIQTIVGELKNEKIDIIRYSDDPVEYIVNALSPAKIISVDILEDSEEAKEALVVVPDDQLSLAIGMGGQNVRLAHRLTGWKIDIKSLSQVEESGYYEQDYQEEQEPQKYAEQEEETEIEITEEELVEDYEEE